MSVVDKPYVSKVLGASEIEAAIREAPAVLRSLIGPDTIITATYGYGSGLHPDICYLPMKVGLKWIEKFLEDSLRQGIVQPANSDFYLTVPNDRLEIEFCHDGHIHVGGTDGELVSRLLSLKPYSGLHLVREKTK